MICLWIHKFCVSLYRNPKGYKDNPKDYGDKDKKK